MADPELLVTAEPMFPDAQYRYSLRPLYERQLPQLLDWRAKVRETLRTTHLLSWEEHYAWYKTLHAPGSTTKYWEVVRTVIPPTGKKSVEEWSTLLVVAFVGLSHIDWPNRRAEINLIVDPEKPRSGIGTEAVRLVLQEAFQYMNLLTVWGECYTENRTAAAFWEEIAEQYQGQTVSLAHTHLRSGTLLHSLYFTIARPTGKDSRDEHAHA